jgi:hypothetical protein
MKNVSVIIATNSELRISIQKPKALLVATKRDHAAVWSSCKQEHVNFLNFT